MQSRLREEVKLERFTVVNSNCIAHKLSDSGSTGWPDRIFAWPMPRGHEYVEFKAEGEVPAALQEYRHTQLAKRGFKVFVIDNQADAKKYINGKLEPSYIPGTGTKKNDDSGGGGSIL